MSRKKRKSNTLINAEKRLSGVKSIDAKLDFGNGLSAAGFNNKVNKVRTQLDTYNTLLSKVDEALNTLIASEQELASMSESMLMSVAIKYGKTSNEYEMAGGRRRSERRRSRGTAQPVAAT